MDIDAAHLCAERRRVLASRRTLLEHALDARSDALGELLHVVLGGLGQRQKPQLVAVRIK